MTQFNGGDRVRSKTHIAGGQVMTFVKETGNGDAVCELANPKTGKLTYPVVPLDDLELAPRRPASTRPSPDLETPRSSTEVP